MFRKIVTEVIYSPALAGTLGNYIKRLRDESSRRQIGLIFALLAVVVQLFATLYPPESANVANPDVFIDSGIESTTAYLEYYDQNSENIRDLLTSLGITRSEIEIAKEATLPTDSKAFLWSIQNSRAADSTLYSFQTTTGKPGIAYHRPFSHGSSTADIPAYMGTSSSRGWFAILKNTGGLITEKPAPSSCAAPSTTDPFIVSSLSSTIDCPDLLKTSLSARVMSASAPTALDKVGASDRIKYALSITNKSASDLSLIPAIGLADILEYSRILDNGGGEYSYDSKLLSWPATTLSAGETLERSYIIQLLPKIPATATGRHVAASYDCTMSASFGNTLAIPIDCPSSKQIELITNNLPELSKTGNLIAAATLLIASLYLYLRSRQLLAELYALRHIHLGGL